MVGNSDWDVFSDRLKMPFTFTPFCPPGAGLAGEGAAGPDGDDRVLLRAHEIRFRRAPRPWRLLKPNPPLGLNAVRLGESRYPPPVGLVVHFSPSSGDPGLFFSLPYEPTLQGGHRGRLGE